MLRFNILMATIAELIDPELLKKLEELKAELERIESNARKEDNANTEGSV